MSKKLSWLEMVDPTGKARMGAWVCLDPSCPCERVYLQAEMTVEELWPPEPVGAAPAALSH